MRTSFKDAARVAVAAGLAAAVATWPGQAAAAVVIGVAGPMSGAFAPLGEDIRLGVEAAVRRLNAAGGIGGEEVVLEVVDDKCEGPTGEAVANQLVGRGAVLVIGHACTAAAIPAAGVYARNGIVMISPAATNPRLTDERIGPGVFRMAPRSDQQPTAIADYLSKSFGDRRVAFVHDGGVYGQGLAEATRQGFEAAGGAAVMTESFIPGEKSQNALVGKIQDAAVSAVVVGALQADAAVVAREMRDRGLLATLIGGEALALEEFRDLAGAAAEGVVFTVPRDWLDESAAAAVVEEIRRSGAEPTGPMLASHAAVETYAAAVDEAGSADFDSVVEAMADGTEGTAIGPVRFDDKGDLIGAGYVLRTWRDGAPAPIE